MFNITLIMWRSSLASTFVVSLGKALMGLLLSFKWLVGLGTLTNNEQVLAILSISHIARYTSHAVCYVLNVGAVHKSVRTKSRIIDPLSEKFPCCLNPLVRAVANTVIFEKS